MFAYAAPSDLPYRPVLLAVTVNDLPGDNLGVVFMQDQTGQLFASASFLSIWGLRTGESQIIAADQSIYFDLMKIHGLTYRWNHEQGEVDIIAPSDTFLPTHLDIAKVSARNVAPYSPGAYFNYDLSLTHGGGVSANQALFDLGLFSGKGLLTSSFTVGSAGSSRLMTTFEIDQVDQIKTLRIGDSFGSTGTWGLGVLFGGFQYGTNFAVRPDFITMPRPSISGKTLLPSTVDVYVNNILQTHQKVGAGPFAIQNLPVITGNGEAKIVVTDLLGRQQVISQPFFVSPDLLREGLVKDSIEFGWLRQNYSLPNNGYSNPFATATYRQGLSNSLTAEMRIELQKGLEVTGASVAGLMPAISSVIEGSLVVSHAEGLVPGVMSSLSYGYLGRAWSANARIQLNSLSFRQIGSDIANLPRQLGAVQLNAPLANGTFSVNYLRQQNQGESLTRIINLNYAHRITDSAFLSLTMIKPLSTVGTTIGLALTMNVDQSHSGSTTLNRQAGSKTLYTDFQQATPLDEGTGYRLAVLNGDAENISRQEASVTRNQKYGSFQADVVRQGGEVSSRLNAAGGIVILDGGIYFSRILNQSFAVVQTKDFSGVPVYLENQEVTQTNQRGRAVVSNLQPYQENRISIDPLSLPIDAAMNEIEKSVIPRSKGGVIIDFEVRRVRSATLVIIQADGQPLPPWTPVDVVGMEHPFVSGNRGEVFVELPSLKENHVIARPPGGPICELSVDMPDSGAAIPRLAPLQCAKSR
ncbi:fimbria/pilus outer membrane usher protein [Undibacterium sp. RuRC25W]|uniref:fimbria/pilus outer membrane usher protein n=1 Tax=Undibacterium sp. RuRC25W TaxID=3413047 RepID=UPI003BF32754